MPITLTALDAGGRVARSLETGAAGATAGWQAKVFAVVWVAGMLLILFQRLMLFQRLTHPARFRRQARGGLMGERERIVATAGGRESRTRQLRD